jgi:hypothetical protein
MALTRDFRETIRHRAQQERKFRNALLCEAIEFMLSRDEKTGRTILRNYINRQSRFPAACGGDFPTRRQSDTHVRPNGNSSAKNLFGVLAHLQAQEGVNFELRPRRA